MASDWFKGQSCIVVLTLLLSKSDKGVLCYPIQYCLSEKQQLHISTFIYNERM